MYINQFQHRRISKLFKNIKKIIVLCLIVLWIISNISAKQLKINSFDKVKFGMSKEEINLFFKNKVNYFNLWKVKNKLVQKNRVEDKFIGSYRIISSNFYLSKNITADLKFTFIENKLFEIMINIKIKNGSKPSLSYIIKNLLSYFKKRFGQHYYEEDIFGDTYKWKKGVKSVRLETMIGWKKCASTIDIMCFDHKLLGKYMKKYSQWKNKKN